MALKALTSVMGVTQALLEHGFEPKTVAEALGKVGAALDVDRVYIFENRPGPDGKLLCNQRFEWTAAKASAQLDNPELQNVAYEKVIPSWPPVLSKGQVLFGVPQDFPSPAKELLESQDIKSLLVCPIMVGRDWWGFVGFDDCRTERRWMAADIEVGQVLASALAGSLRHALLRSKLTGVKSQLQTIIQRCNDRAQTAGATPPVLPRPIEGA